MYIFVMIRCDNTVLVWWRENGYINENKKKVIDSSWNDFVMLFGMITIY
jgi:hypothetical protein